MTREDFIENIQSWEDLISFCSDYGCDYCEDVYDDDQMDDYINETLVDMARNSDGWRDLRNMLNDIPTGYDYYIRDEYDEFREADDDEFEDYKSSVLEWGDDGDVWDEDEEEDYYDDEDEEPAPTLRSTGESNNEEEDVVEEGCSLKELFESGVDSLRALSEKEELDEINHEDVLTMAS